MRLTYKAITLLTLASATVLLGGCGGGSTSSALPSLYRGSWTGPWNSSTLNDRGTMAIAVQADGSASGTISRTGSLNGNYGGIFGSNGTVTATAAFPSSGNFIISGSVATNNGHLVGSYNFSYLGTMYSGNFDLSPTGGAGGSTGG